MTIASAIDDVIIAQGGTPDPTDTIADSLVNLAGVLAGENYPKDKTIEDAVTLLGEHIGGGGGGSFGPLQFVVIETNIPEAGHETDGGMPNMLSISSGSTVIAAGTVFNPVSTPVAAGLTAVSIYSAEYTECDAYVCNVESNEEVFIYTSVEPWDGTITIGSIEQFGETYATYTLTVPELDYDPETFTGEFLVLYVHS